MKKIILAISPMAAPRLNRKSRFHPKKCGLWQRYLQWKQEVAWLAQQAGWQPTDDLSVRFILPMPKSWSKKKQQKMDGQPHQQRPDRNNLTKALEDALYEDDCQVWRSIEEKRWGKYGQIILYTEDDTRKNPDDATGRNNNDSPMGKLIDRDIFIDSGV